MAIETGITYRPATVADIDFLVESRLQFIEAKTEDDNYQLLGQTTRQFFEQGLAQESCDVVLA